MFIFVFMFEFAEDKLLLLLFSVIYFTSCKRKGKIDHVSETVISALEANDAVGDYIQSVFTKVEELKNGIDKTNHSFFTIYMIIFSNIFIRL